MLKRIAHTVLSCWLALLLLFGGTAKEYIHLFAPHKDTVHKEHKHGELSFENEHHHCSFLGYALTPFIQQDLVLVSCQRLPVFFLSKTGLSQVLFDNLTVLFSFRGPPAADC